MYLLRTAVDMDSERLAELYTIHWHEVVKFISARGLGHIAEELAQEVFIKVWRYHPEYPGPYLMGIARHTMADQWRRTKSRHRLEDLPLENYDAPTTPPAIDVHIDVERLIASLPEKWREPVRLHYLMELSVPETAIALGVSRITAKGLISRGIQYLRRKR